MGRRLTIWARLALLVLGAGSVGAADRPQTVSLAAGQEATVQLQRRSVVTIRQGEAGPLSEFYRSAITQLTGGTYENAVGPNSAPITSRDISAEPTPIAPDALRFIFVRVPGQGHSVLFVENGYGRAMAYRARIYANGRSAPTDVCVVLPRLRGVEHWPYRIDRIELSQLRLERWREGQPPRCE
jgi:hypothetical protein